MILRRLRLRRFKKFADWTGTFAPGLNVICGPNEAGKSTVLEALYAALAVNPAAPPAGFVEQVRPWGETRAGEVTLEFEVDGRAYLLRKDFEAGTALLQRQDGNERTADTRAVQQRMLAWLGVPSATLFRSTAFVAQGELARLTDDRRHIAGQLTRVLSGAGTEDVEAALRWLDERRARAAAAGRGSGDEAAATLEAQRRDLERRAEHAETLAVELRTVTRRLTAVEREVTARRERLAALEQEATLGRRLQEMERELAQSRDLLARLHTLSERLAALEARAQQVSNQREAALRALVQARRQLTTLEQALRTARDTLDREERTLEHLAARHHEARRRSGVGLVLGGFGAAATAAGTVLALLRDLPAAWGATLAGLVVILLGMRTRGRVSETESVYRTQEQRVLRLRQQVEQARGALDAASRDFRARLDALGVASVEAVEQQYAAFIEAVHQHEELRLAIHQLLGNQTREALEQRARDLEAELAQLRARVSARPEAGVAGPPPPERARGATPAPAAPAERLARELEGLEKEAALLRDRRTQLERQLAEMPDHAEQLLVLEERLAALRARQAAVQEEVAVLDLTRQLLEEARRQSFVPARELLERRASEYFRQATRDGYQRVGLEERGLVPKAWVNRAGGWTSVQHLSRGTADQLYLAVRLALVDLVCQGRTPPLFLDEPFAHFDAARAEAVAALLAVAARQRQVFLFTARVPEAFAQVPAITLAP